MSVGIQRDYVHEAGPKLAAAPALDPQVMGVRRFIADTGCGYNLIGADCIKCAGAEDHVQRLPHNVTLNTAGGNVGCNRCVDIQCDTFPEGEFNALVLEHTPSVVSIGQRCREMGYAFHWHSCSNEPYFEAPDGTIIPLVVYGNVPYLEKLTTTDPAVPAELGAEDVACPTGSLPEGEHPTEGEAEGEPPLVGDGDD